MQQFTKYLLWLLFSLYFSTVQARNGDDWVLVERYQDQLELANQGKPAAMYEVGHMFELGRGVKQNMAQAIAWYRKASSRGQHNATTRLGIFYYTGKSLTKDYAKAIELLQIAADTNVADAQYYLGLMYEKGHGVAANLQTALKWLQLATAAGHYQASQRVKTLKVKLIQSKKAKAKTTDVLTIVAGNEWQLDGQAVAYLPSSLTRCKQKNRTTMICQSRILTKSSGNADVITYSTRSTLSAANKVNQLNIDYQDTIIRIAKPGAKANEIDEEEYSIARQSAAAKKLPEKISLKCALRNNQSLHCKNSRGASIVMKKQP